MKKAFILFLLLIVGITAAIVVSGIGCSRVVDETTTTGGGAVTTTTASGGTTTTTAAAGTTTTTTSSATTTTLLAIRYPTDSCTAIQNDPTNVHNLSTLLLVGWDGAGSNEAFIKFDVSTIPLITIKSAILKIYITAVSTTTTNIEIFHLNNNWYANTLTWNNMPGKLGAAIATKTISFGDAGGAPVSIDITPLAQAWINSGGISNNGLVIINPDFATLDLLSISSSVLTATNPPILEIRY